MPLPASHNRPASSTNATLMLFRGPFHAHRAVSRTAGGHCVVSSVISLNASAWSRSNRPSGDSIIREEVDNPATGAPDQPPLTLTRSTPAFSSAAQNRPAPSNKSGQPFLSLS